MMRRRATPRLEELGPHPERGVLVGGAVRDALRGRTPRDFDWRVPDPASAARALADRMAGSAFELDARRRHWRVLADGVSHDLVPADEPLEDDLRRRDLTVNAMALTDEGLVDPFGGADDLRRRRLRAVTGSALHDDPLRGLRAVRLAAQLDFAWEDGTRRQAAEAASRLARGELPFPSWERVRDELAAILMGGAPGDVLLEAHRLGWLALALPELIEGEGLEQGGFHHLDVLHHQLEALQRLAGGFPESDESLRWATLLHDVGKPRCRGHHPDGRVHFHGHAELGGALAGEMLHRLRLPSRRVQRAAEMVRQHMVQLPANDKEARRFVHRRRAILPDLVKLMIADREAARGPLSSEGTRRRYRLALARVIAILEEAPTGDEPPPLLDGRDVMSLLGLEPGPRVGEALRFVREARAVGDVQNRDEAVRALRRFAHARGWVGPGAAESEGVAAEAVDPEDAASDAQQQAAPATPADATRAAPAARGATTEAAPATPGAGDEASPAAPAPARGARRRSPAVRARRRRWLAFAPSLVLGLVGLVAVWLRPWPFQPTMDPWTSLGLGLATGAAMLAASALLERWVPSFRWASRALEQALAQLGLSRGAAAGLGLATALGEELLFRGVLLPWLGLWPQALLFGLLHPAGRRGWSYQVFTALAGLALGALVVSTGRLAPAMVAHGLVNLVGLLAGRTRSTAARPRAR